MATINVESRNSTFFAQSHDLVGPNVASYEALPTQQIGNLAGSSGATPAATGATASRPHKMKFSAIWDVEKTPTNCVPRMCRLNVSRLEIKPNSFQASEMPAAALLAVKIQGRRRTLRSTEIPLLPAGNFVNGGAVELNMEFSLTYPHFLKRSNHIEVMLQRKKHYKNRTIPGYKTLAIARLDMNEVLQRPMMSLAPDDQPQSAAANDGQTILDLCAPVSSAGADPSVTADQPSGQSDKNVPLASLRLTSASEPVPKCPNLSRSDDDVSSGADDPGLADDSDDIFGTGDDAGDSGHNRRAMRRHHHGDVTAGGSSKSAGPANAKKNFKSMALGQQTKFKQKIVSLLKKMKVSGPSARGAASGLVSPPVLAGSAKDAAFGINYYWEERDYDRDDLDLSGRQKKHKSRRNSFPPGSTSGVKEQSLEDLEAEIENWAPNSDEESNGDGVSLAVTVQPTETTPKPSLRPFFFSDLRLSSEQLPLLIDESSQDARRKHDAKATSSEQPSHRIGSWDRDNSERQMVPVPVVGLAHPQPPATSPSGQGSPTKLALAGDIRGDQKTTSEPLQLPQNLALSPGIQLEHIFQTSTEMPSHVILVYDQSLANLAKACASLPDGLNIVSASNLADVDVFFAEITRLIEKFTNQAPAGYPLVAPPQPGSPQLKLVLCGSSDAFFAAVTQSFVERFSSRLPNASGLVRLLPVPLFYGSAIAQLLSAVSYNYRVFLESTESTSLLLQLQDLLLLPTCLKRQLDLFSIPIGEVLLTIRDKSSENRGSRQIVLPFICDVQINIVRTSATAGNPLSTPGTTAGASSASAGTSQAMNSTVMPLSQAASGCPVPVSQSLPSGDTASLAANTNGHQQQQPPAQQSGTSCQAMAGGNSIAVSNTNNQSVANNNSCEDGSVCNANLNANPGAPANSSANNSSGSPPQCANNNSAWMNAAPSTPGGTHGSLSTGFSTLSSQQGLLSGAVLPSPDVPANSASSAAFDVNIDYWLEPSVGAAQGVAGATGGMSLGPQGSSLLATAPQGSAASVQASAAGASAGGAKPCNLKGSYRQMLVTRTMLNASGEVSNLQQSAMTMIMNARDKKIKKIWPTRKSRDSLGGPGGDKAAEAVKGQTIIEGINRLVCNVKSSSSGHKVVVCVDGVEYTGVKFFQISLAWHSHVKNFPVFTPIPQSFSSKTSDAGTPGSAAPVSPLQPSSHLFQQHSLC